jgi:release factor glutamine methyltransferase
VIEEIRNNTLEGIWNWFTGQLDSKFERTESQALARMVFEHYLGINSSDLILKKETRYSESQIVLLYKALIKLKLDVPVQYITGQSFFRDLILKVDPNVLIPRPETEELVQWVCDDFKSKKIQSQDPIKVWDIGTGSGAIAISLATELQNALVTATDISVMAIEIAKENANKNQANVVFKIHNIITDKLPSDLIDCIVSNPPYIMEKEKPLMQKNVLDFEPELALFVPDNDPLVYYKAIAKVASVTLNPEGSVYVEINEALGQETANVFRDSGFASVEIRKDIHGKDRFVKAFALSK